MEMNQLDSDLHLPPRKRLLAGYKKLNSNGNGSSSSSSSTSNSNRSSSASTNVQTHLTSRLHSDQNQSPEELVEAARSAAALAVKAAKTARAIANEKALISSNAVAVAKRALELVDSFPKEVTVDCKDISPKKNKKKKHVPVDYLSPATDEEDAVARMERAIDRRYIKFLKFRLDFAENSQINKKQKMNKTGYNMNGIAVVVDSDSSYEGLESNRKAFKEFKPDEVDWIPTPGKEKAEEESNSLVKRRGRVKVKKLSLSVCNSRDQENGISCVSPVPVAQLPEEGVVRSSSRKCQDLKASECVKQNKAVRS